MKINGMVYSFLAMFPRARGKTYGEIAIAVIAAASGGAAAKRQRKS